MTRLVRQLLHLEPWYVEWLGPVRHALNCDNVAEAQEKLLLARDALARSNFSADERLALSYEFLVFEFHFIERQYPRDQHVPEVQRAMNEVVEQLRARPPVGLLSDSLLAYWLIAYAAQGVRRGYFDLSEAEFRACYARVPPGQRSREFWYFASTWAYYHRHADLLEQALEVHATETTGQLDDYFFGRTRMMLRLVTGEATKVDVRGLINSYSHPQHIIDFRNLFLARCTDAGLIDDEIMLLLETREAYLEAALSGLPVPRTSRTRSLMQNTRLIGAREEE